MEKTMSVDEKIRRAEEIYNRRNSVNYYTYSSKTNEKKAPSLIRKMIKQIIVCFMIYGIFYVVSNKEYFLSSEFQEKVENIASQNETVNTAYQYVKGYIGKYFELNEENVNENQDTQEMEQTQTESNQETELIDNNDENIGGSAEDDIVATEEKSQEEKDVEDIKNTISFVTPVLGTVSSTFGWRTPTTQTVPKYHTGLDIAATTGTVIKSATDGIVTLVSSEGDYGKHYKITNGDITIIYAHCSKLYLNEGDTVYQGQEIAEVGSTGNSTRSAFTF